MTVCNLSDVVPRNMQNRADETILYPYALNETKLDFVYIHDVIEHDTFYCAICEAPMSAHIGKKKQRHFAHIGKGCSLNGGNNGGGGGESPAHAFTIAFLQHGLNLHIANNRPLKQVITCPEPEKRGFKQYNSIPYGIIQAPVINKTKIKGVSKRFMYDILANIDRVEREGPIKDENGNIIFKTDLSLYCGNRLKMAVEVVFSNPISDEKRRYYQEHLIDVLEVDISEYQGNEMALLAQLYSWKQPGINFRDVYSKFRDLYCKFKNTIYINNAAPIRTTKEMLAENWKIRQSIKILHDDVIAIVDSYCAEVDLLKAAYKELLYDINDARIQFNALKRTFEMQLEEQQLKEKEAEQIQLQQMREAQLCAKIAREEKIAYHLSEYHRFIKDNPALLEIFGSYPDDVERMLECFPNDLYLARPSQIEAMLQIVKYEKEGKKIFFLQSPPGTGKSAVSIAVCRYFDNGYILTPEKALQDQYKEYLCASEYSCAICKGRASFSCFELADTSCSRGKCTINIEQYDELSPQAQELLIERIKRGEVFDCLRKLKKSGDYDRVNSASRGSIGFIQADIKDRCSYWEQKAEALKADITISNYKFLMADGKFSKDFGVRGILVCDEGHCIEGQIADMISISIPRSWLRVIERATRSTIKMFESEATLNVRQEDQFSIHFKWLKGLSKELSYILNTPKNNTSSKDAQQDAVDEGELAALHKKIEYVITSIEKNKNNWIVKETRSKNGKDVLKLEFCPICIDSYADEYLFRLGERCLIESGTILDFEHMIRYLGIKEDDCAYIHLKPSFPTGDKHKIFSICMPVDFNYNILNKPGNREKFYQRTVIYIDLILELHPYEKGLVHCGTNELCKYIVEHSKYANRLLYHTNVNDDYDFDSAARKTEILKKQRDVNNTEPTVLISPSMLEGVDLPGEASTFQILIKLPYLNMGDARIKARMNDDNKYYDLYTARAINQAVMRSIRSEEDKVVTYILDNRFNNFLDQNTDYLSELIVPFINDNEVLRELHRDKEGVIAELLKHTCDQIAGAALVLDETTALAVLCGINNLKCIDSSLVCFAHTHGFIDKSGRDYYLNVNSKTTITDDQQVVITRLNKIMRKGARKERKKEEQRQEAKNRALFRDHGVPSEMQLSEDDWLSN